MEEQVLESVHCYSPTPPIGRRMTINYVIPTNIIMLFLLT